MSDEQKQEQEDQKDEQKQDEQTDTSVEEKVEEKEEEEKAEEKPKEKKEEIAEQPKKEEKKPVKIPAKFKEVVEEIEKMTVMDLAELVKLLEEKFGVSAQAPVAVAVAGASGGDTGPSEEKSSFNVELTETGGNKIAVIKAIREITQIGLKEAKDLADGAPKMVKEEVKKEEAEEMKKKLEEAGAKVTLK